MNVAYQMRRPTPARTAVRWAAVAAGVLALLLLSLPVGRAQDRPGAVQRIKTIGFTVGDIERAANFFVNVLQFEKLADFASSAASTTPWSAYSTPTCASCS